MVIVAAAKVGGIHANNTYPANFPYGNIVIATNTIHSAFETGVKRLRESIRETGLMEKVRYYKASS